MNKTISASRRRWLAGAAAVLLGGTMSASAVLARDAAPFTGIPGTTVRFASVDEGRRLISALDDWTAATSEFQRAATLGTTPPVALDRFIAALSATVLPWTDEERQPWQQALGSLAGRFAELKIPLPPEVLLVRTNGKDAAHAPYTRANAVFLPRDARLEGDSIPFVLAHELFHVASRHQPGWASALYAAIGFRPVDALQWPAPWLPSRIANPDAPLDRHAMSVTLPDGRKADVMPLLVARRTELQPGETFFDVMDVRLLEVEAAPGRPTTPVMRGGAPAWHAPRALPDYLRQLGGNTGYIIHPEETLADNVALLVTGRTVRNPALLTRIEALLMQARP
ncbi:hypothetical protein [Ideonella sp. BN130291]|uniref:hypothetical protein n=1 Tax=Ideonella sp. BN130291 TaxID=3112940 RepID=UPI002E26DF30|nr:hypothetical protein [Ideonella sp. BN130291]